LRERRPGGATSRSCARSTPDLRSTETSRGMALASWPCQPLDCARARPRARWRNGRDGRADISTRAPLPNLPDATGTLSGCGARRRTRGGSSGGGTRWKGVCGLLGTASGETRSTPVGRGRADGRDPARGCGRSCRCARKFKTGGRRISPRAVVGSRCAITYLGTGEGRVACRAAAVLQRRQRLLMLAATWGLRLAAHGRNSTRRRSRFLPLARQGVRRRARVL